jgi:hypothetical protein
MPRYPEVEVSRSQALNFTALGDVCQWTLPWTMFILAIAIGRMFNNEDFIRTAEMLVGLPAAFVASAASRQNRALIASVAYLVLLVGGLAIGILVR